MDIGLAEKLLAAEESFAHEADSLGQLLERLRSRISPVLIGDPEWERLLERVRPLPTTMAAFPFGFELPLHDSRPRADFGLPVVGGGRSAAFFEKAGRSEGASPRAAGIARLLAETEAEDSPLRRVTGRLVGLEYDIDTAGDGRHPEPGILLYPIKGTLAGDRSRRGLRDVGMMADAVTSASGKGPDAALRRQVEELYLAMEPDTTVGMIGSLRGSGLRLTMDGFRTGGSVVALLERAGWPGQRSFVASTLSRYEERGAFAYLQVGFDVEADGVGPALGLSFFARETQFLKDIQYWRPLMDGMSEDRLVVPEKLSALADSFLGSETLFGPSGPSVLVRGIHHIKFKLIGDRIEQVKAYVFLLMLRPFMFQQKSSAA